MNHSQFYFKVVLGVLLKKGILSTEEIDNINEFILSNPSRVMNEESVSEILNLVGS